MIFFENLEKDLTNKKKTAPPRGGGRGGLGGGPCVEEGVKKKSEIFEGEKIRFSFLTLWEGVTGKVSRGKGGWHVSGRRGGRRGCMGREGIKKNEKFRRNQNLEKIEFWGKK